MARHRTLPSVEALLAGLADAGVEDAPREGPDEETLKGLLDLALFVAEHRKRVSFPGFRWDDPRFRVADARTTLDVAYATLAGDSEDAVRWTMEANLPRAGDGRTLLALDAHTTRAREFEIGHALFGRVTLFAWPTKPPEPADPRIDAAREKGWAKVLKEHNLLPGRGIVVLDEHQGLMLRDARYDSLLGLLLLLPDGGTPLWWNPFVRAEHNDAEMQFWLTWGAGTQPASGWRELLRVDRDGLG